MTTTNLHLTNVPAPAGATHVHDWEDRDTADPYRYRKGPRAVIHCRRSTVAVWGGGLQGGHHI